MRDARASRLTAPLVASAALLLLGCSVPSEPSPADWRSSARQVLEDSASEVQSVALVLKLYADDQLPGSTARVAAVESEESLATAADSLTTQQPPAGLGSEDADVADLLGRSSDLVREARIAITREDEASYDDLRARLLDLADDLDAERGGLG